VDYIKISFPAPDEETMTRLTGNKTTWRRKWDALEHLEKLGIRTDILTVMTSENIRQFDNSFAYWNRTVDMLEAATCRNAGRQRHPVSREKFGAWRQAVRSAQSRAMEVFVVRAGHAVLRVGEPLRCNRVV